MTRWIYELRSISRNDRPHFWGAKPSRGEAERAMRERFEGKSAEWAAKHHKRWWIEEIDATGMFEFPSQPMPRDRFSVVEHVIAAEPGYGSTLEIDVIDAEGRVITRFTRNYGGYGKETFEPFRQGEKMFALVAPDYTATSVMDLASGDIIAGEEPDSGGFCPVGFYVPDWWDINDGSTLPGSHYWSDDSEHPKGDFGFVWGCVWGDDSSWKIQVLDLSRIQHGEIRRDERFGYVKLASALDVHPKEFIECNFRNGTCRVTLRTEQDFDLETGKPLD